MHRARAALRHAASKLSAVEAKHIAQHPQQWHVVGHVHLRVLAIDGKDDHQDLLARRTRGTEPLESPWAVAARRPLRLESSARQTKKQVKSFRYIPPYPSSPRLRFDAP